MIHFLGMTLSCGEAVALAGGLGSALGCGLGWLIRDFQSWGKERF